MNIVFLSFYSGLEFRGAETFVDALAKRLSQNHKVTVFQAGQIQQNKNYDQIKLYGNYSHRSISPNNPLRRFFLDYHYRQILIFTIRSLKKIRDLRPDIIIPVNGGWQTLLIKFFIDAKLIISGQAGLGWDERWNLLLKPDLFVALTRRNADWVKESFPSQNMTVIPNGVDLSFFKASGRKANKYKLNKPLVLCVAGGEEYKRVEATIRAVALLSSASLLVVGGSRKIEELGARLLGSRFLQIKVPHKEMPQVYKSADVFTLVSRSSEAFGTAYIEAMASGLGVVAPNDKQRAEIIGNAGVYVNNPEDYKEYALKIVEALGRNWKDIPYMQAQKYDWDDIAARYEKEMLKLIK
jgi:glycosyltransferase involved in cell wall biosynthesis